MLILLLRYWNLHNVIIQNFIFFSKDMFFNLRRKNDLLNSCNLIPVKFATKEAEIKLSEITAICIFRVYQ